MGGIPEFVLWRGRFCDRGALGEIHVDAWWVPRIHVLECVHHGIGHHAIGLMGMMMVMLMMMMMMRGIIFSTSIHAKINP